jgi:hypothetical protein
VARGADRPVALPWRPCHRCLRDEYSQSEFTVSGEYAETLRRRNSTFAHFAKTKGALHTVLITTYGLTPNLHAGSIYATVTMDELFAK